MTGYQWLVIFAAWLGWGFDVYDGLLFNYVAPLCVPELLGLDKNDPASAKAITFWTGALSSLLLVGWGIGGILFGKIADKLGRSRTLLLTMVLFSLATAGCAFATNIWMLVAFRFIAALGIGGEWAAGASLVAETVPENKRVTAGAILYTASPAGLFLATFVNELFTHKIDAIATSPWAWRAVFLTGLVPAFVAFLIRLKVKEPEMWEQQKAAAPRIRELFTPTLRRRTIGALAMSVIALLAWWSTFSFIPRIAGMLATETGANRAHFMTIGTNAFNLGGLIGTLLTIPIATKLGRRPMFLIYFLVSAVSIFCTFGLEMEARTRLYSIFFVGLGVFGVFGSFTFYLPELFPTRLRGTGAGFCYNTGRFIAAFGPFVVGSLVDKSHGSGELSSIISYVAIFPALGVVLILFGLCEETKHQSLADVEREPAH